MSEIYPYHVSGRCNNSEWFSIDLNVVWEVIEKHLKKMKTRDKIRVHHFVLMNNHYHMIISTPYLNLGAAMCNFQRDISRELNYFCGRKDHLLGKRYFSCILEKSFHYLIVLKYVYRNSVRAGINENVENYAFSTLNKRSDVFDLSDYDEQLCLFRNNDSTISWLNEPFDKKLEEIVKRSLRKMKFKLPIRVKKK